MQATPPKKVDVATIATTATKASAHSADGAAPVFSQEDNRVDSTHRDKQEQDTAVGTKGLRGEDNFAAVEVMLTAAAAPEDAEPTCQTVRQQFRCLRCISGT